MVPPSFPTSLLPWFLNYDWQGGSVFPSTHPPLEHGSVKLTIATRRAEVEEFVFKIKQSARWRASDIVTVFILHVSASHRCLYSSVSFLTFVCLFHLTPYSRPDWLWSAFVSHFLKFHLVNFKLSPYCIYLFVSSISITYGVSPKAIFNFV